MTTILDGATKIGEAMLYNTLTLVPYVVFTVPLVIQQYIENYCLRNGIRRDELLFPLTERAIQK